MIISDLKLQVSVLETERNEYNLSASRLEEEVRNLEVIRTGIVDTLALCTFLFFSV